MKKVLHAQTSPFFQELFNSKSSTKTIEVFLAWNDFHACLWLKRAFQESVPQVLEDPLLVRGR
jgi:hypothetical protein